MEIPERIKALIFQELDQYKAELIDLQLKGNPRRFQLCIIADKEDGISINDCADISRRLSQNPELDELLGANYQLEVSSPGINRALKTEANFRLKIDKELEVFYSENDMNRKIKGRLFEVLKDGIYIEVDNKQVFVQFRQIIKAVQALPW